MDTSLLPEEIRSRIDTSSECWRWSGAHDRDGYAKIGGWTTTQVHRIAFIFLVGEIADGLTIDHLCRNRWCVNPAHMEPVTQAENVLRGMSPAAQQARKTHCLRGHHFDAANTIREGNHRRCRACRDARNRVRRVG